MVCLGYNRSLNSVRMHIPCQKLMKPWIPCQVHHCFSTLDLSSGNWQVGLKNNYMEGQGSETIKSCSPHPKHQEEERTLF